MRAAATACALAARVPTRAEIEAARHTRGELAAWGVTWPPRKGWRKRLLREADQRDGTSPPPAAPTSPTPPAVRSSDDGGGSRVRTGAYVAGEPHRCWPEWTWDGFTFVKTARYRAEVPAGPTTASPAAPVDLEAPLLEALREIRAAGRAKGRWQTIAVARGLAVERHGRLRLTPVGNAKLA